MVNALNRSVERSSRLGNALKNTSVLESLK